MSLLNWLNICQQIVDNYNRTPHSSHGLAPLDVTNENRATVYKKLYPNSVISVECRLKVGDKVRHILDKKRDEKGYTPNWSEDIYTITNVRQSHKVCWFTLADSSGQTIPGIWYFYQLNLVASYDN